MKRTRLLTFGLAVAMAVMAALAIAQRTTSTVTVATVDDPVLGTILVDADGKTLYVRLGETASSLLCTGTCLNQWAPAAAPASGISAQSLQFTGAGDAGVDFSAVARSDGTQQLTYRGQPLYSAAGDVAGASLANGLDGVWFAANAVPLVRVVRHPVHGEILVGPNGRTLYYYQDDEGEEAGYQCDEACSENFPPLVVSNRFFVEDAGRTQSDLNAIDRLADSRRASRVQVSHEGRPLYYWSRDTRPGDVTGDGIAGLWRVARP